MSKPFRSKKSPYWQYDIQIRGRRFHGSTSTTSYTAAKAFIERIRKEAAEGPQKERLTLDTAFGLYWSNVAKAQSSARTTRSQAVQVIRHFGPNELLANIKQADFAVYATTRRASVSVATVNRELQLCRRVWRYCAEVLETDIGKEPKWKLLIQKEPPERVRELSTDEQDRLFLHLREDFRDFTLFCLLTGMRVSSAISLLWDDVHWNGMYCVIRVKGGGVQQVPLTQRTAALLRAQPVAAPEVFTYRSHRKRGDQRIGDRRVMTYGALKAVWKPALKAAGIRDLRFHDTRHTAATRTLRASGNMKAVQKLLGHASITTTGRYAHALLDDVRDALEAVEK